MEVPEPSTVSFTVDEDDAGRVNPQSQISFERFLQREMTYFSVPCSFVFRSFVLCFLVSALSFSVLSVPLFLFSAARFPRGTLCISFLGGPSFSSAV